METPIISVIVPAYNLENYVAITIESVIAQTFSSWELVLVNDGSRDNTLLVCKNYAKQDKRIVVCDQPNGGVSKARQTGFLNSRGEFILFLDGDDVLTPDALDTMIRLQRKYNVDVVVPTFVKNNKVRRILCSGFLNKDEYFKNTILANLPMSTQNRLYRRSVFGCYDDIVERSIVNHEDYLTNIMYAKNIKSAFVANIPTYIITVRPGSAGRTPYPVGYWMHFFSYSRSLFEKEGIPFGIYYVFFLEKFYSLIRTNKDFDFDYNNPIFLTIKEYKDSVPLSFKARIALYVINHPYQLLIKILRLHPRKIIRK